MERKRESCTRICWKYPKIKETKRMIGSLAQLRRVLPARGKKRKPKQNKSPQAYDTNGKAHKPTKLYATPIIAVAKRSNKTWISRKTNTSRLPPMEDPLPKSKKRQRIEKKFQESKKQQSKGEVNGLVPQVRSSAEFFFSSHLIASLGIDPVLVDLL